MNACVLGHGFRRGPARSVHATSFSFTWHQDLGTELGAKLQELRKRANLSAREAARRLGLSTTRLRDFEMGKTHGRYQLAVPKRTQLAKFAEVYGYPLDNLLRLAGFPIEEPAAPVPPSELEVRAREVAQIYVELPELHRALLMEVALAFKREAKR